MNAPLLSRILLAHLMADFPLQPDELNRLKDKIWGIVAHTAVFGMTVALLFNNYLRIPRVAITLVGLTLFHGLFDLGKTELKKRFGRDSIWLFWLDQSLHLVSIFLAAYFLRLLHIPQNRLIDSLIIAVIAIWVVPVVVGLTKLEFVKPENRNMRTLKLSSDKLGILERVCLFVAGLEMGWFMLLGLIIIPRIIGWFFGRKIGTEPIIWATALCLGAIAERIIT